MSLKITNDGQSNQNMPSAVVRSSQVSKETEVSYSHYSLFPPTVCDKCVPITLFIFEHTLYHNYLLCHILTERLVD